MFPYFLAYLEAVVGAATFPAAKWIFAIIAYAAAATQILGLIGVHQVGRTHRLCCSCP